MPPNESGKAGERVLSMGMEWALDEVKRDFVLKESARVLRALACDAVKVADKWIGLAEKVDNTDSNFGKDHFVRAAEMLKGDDGDRLRKGVLAVVRSGMQMFHLDVDLVLCAVAKSWGDEELPANWRAWSKLAAQKADIAGSGKQLDDVASIDIALRFWALVAGSVDSM